MELYKHIQSGLPEYSVELVTSENIDRYEDVFYCNQDYYLITDGRTATRQDCIDTIEFALNDPGCVISNIGFSVEEKAVAFLSIIKAYPELSTLYIGLFLMHDRFKRKNIGTKIVKAVIKEAFCSGFDTIKLSVQDNNTAGYAFWRSLGFKVTHTTDCTDFCNLSMEMNLKG